MAKWIRARPYVTVEEVAARIQQYQQQQAQQAVEGTAAATAQNAEAFSRLGQLLAVAVAR